MLIEVTIKCYRLNTDLQRLAETLDATLQSQGYEVYELITRIVREDDANKDGA